MMFATMLAPLKVIFFRAERIVSQRGRMVWLVACLAYLPILFSLGYLGTQPLEGIIQITSQIILALFFAFYLAMPTLRRILQKNTT